MAFALKSKDEAKVDFGFCCSFKQSIPSSTKSTIVTPPRAPELSTADPPDTEFLLVSDESANKKCHRHLNNNKDNDPVTINFLSVYFQEDTPPASMKPANMSQIVGCLNKSRRKSRRPKYTTNNFQGALVFPPFGLLVEADATSHHLSCDHMALAESSEDYTKPVIHGVISETNAKIVQMYFNTEKKSIRRINTSRKRIILNVTYPEDIMKNMNVVVYLFVVKQVTKSSEFQDWKGNTHFDPEFIANLQTFYQDDIAANCYTTIILREFTLRMKAKRQSYYFSVQVVCFVKKASPNHKVTLLLTVSTITLDHWQAEEGLKSDGHVGPQEKSATRQTRTY